MRYPFLAVLARGPAHGYELKQALEQCFGDLLPPLNHGQVYTTLARLERDGLVQGSHVCEDPRNKRIYQLTEAGRAMLLRWIEAPVTGAKLKDEFFMKLVLGRLAGIAELKTLVECQRRGYLQELRALTDLARKTNPQDGQVASLLIDGAALHLEADLKWLDLCEERFGQEA